MMFSWLFGDEHRANLALEKALARAYIRIDELKLENARLEAALTAIKNDLRVPAWIQAIAIAALAKEKTDE